jgi:hypothetical protein
MHQLRKVVDVEARHHGLNTQAKASLELLRLLFLLWNEVYSKPRQLNELSRILHHRYAPLN